jgi:hypothetical protein
MRRTNRVVYLLSSFALLHATWSFAAPVVTTDGQAAPAAGGASFTPTYAPSATDLINGRAPSASNGDFALELAGGLPVLTDGAYGTITQPGGAPDRTHGAFATAGNTAGTAVTYALDTAAHPLGFDISSIAVYGGWNDNGRDQQMYRVLYSTTANPSNFINLASVDFNPNVPADTQSATRSVITDPAAGRLAPRGAALQFQFLTPENGYTGYAEIDVLGSATVPEPAGFALVCIGAAALMARRVRRGSRCPATR